MNREREMRLGAGWSGQLKRELDRPYMIKLREFLISEKDAGKTIFPPVSEIFSAFDYTPFENVKVVVIGQDPYHGPNQAHGLCFSVKKGVVIPPSLKNIYKELESDLGILPVSHGYLESWAIQGVLMINAVLSVEIHQAASHRGKGWEEFTDKVIDVVNREKENVVFMLWGSSAQKKGSVIDRSRHLVLEAPHPSPLSAYRGFFGCRHFSKCNEYLKSHGISPIDWQLSEEITT